MSDVLVVERTDHVETWTINLPDQRNPISGADVVEAFEVNVRRVQQDLDVRCVVLTGAGKAFSAGGNVNDMREKAGMFSGSPWQMRNGYRDGIQRIPLALTECEVPVVAAVNGPAVGAGCDLALMCDLRVASTHAWFAESFVQLGIIPGDGGAWLLTQAVGPQRAAEMALTGDRVDAQKALEWGLVAHVVEPEELLDEARALAERVAKNPPHATRMAKRLLKESRTHDLRHVLELSATMQALSHHTEDHAEAMDAVLDKRSADFRGR
ncbi:crotonase/enoyl-CoA hydratase family protein [Saccharopolyspora rhizosphaerae]|uniref:Crotonase/enoyl-CoA hydratase family protein n=1 Tax=Saccharopolyspora rhizosphaerae TaxID=2492662 RepID=A0A3R8QYZ5_9PSEU|nr:crotonase/enoyl-CoA hydratase family protein [Saccharopolyspora rhizosphaerae]RRO14137.1 crotonase/enoyl-CoA hydratase family protein [Saccharopolyspora rhizosphaerae]